MDKLLLSLLSALSFIALIGLLACHSSQTSLTQNQKQMSDDLKVVIDEHLTANIVKPSFGGRVFCAHKTLAIEEDGGGVNEYVFAVCQEYKRSNGTLNQGTGTAVPVALRVKNLDGTVPVITHKVPRDSPMYERDIERMFPAQTHDEIFYGRRDAILLEAEKKAKRYFDGD